jgi:hypothetical protein
MREALSLCAHLAALAPGDVLRAPAPDEILEWYDGAVDAVVRCAECGACGWLSLLDWNRARPPRIYALAPLRAEDVALYVRNRARGSCDAARLRAELDALVASAGPFERLVALDPDSHRVLAAEPLAVSFTMPAGPFWERMPAPDDDRWFARLGLAKGAAR